MSGIPADAFESEQVFCSPALLTKTLSAFLSLKMRVSSRATPSFFPPAAPSGITHYTFVPKVVCQRGLPPPLETLLALSEMGTHRAFRVATFPPNPQNKNGVSCHCVTAHAALFCSPSAPCSRSAFANVCGLFANAIQHNSFL